MDAKYGWQAAYNAAILETDEAGMRLRILEAKAAIEQRLLSEIQVGSEESIALHNASRSLAELETERANRNDDSTKADSA